MYDSPRDRESELAAEVAGLTLQLAEAQLRLDKKDPDSRGYDEHGEFLICRFDRTVTDSMDAHDGICTDPNKR